MTKQIHAKDFKCWVCKGQADTFINPNTPGSQIFPACNTHADEIEEQVIQGTIYGK